MSSRFNAAAKFGIDAFAMSFIAILLIDETLHPLLLWWPVLSFAAALAAFLLFAKLPYTILAATAIASGTALAAVAFGFPLWLAAGLLLAALYRLHERFSATDDGSEALGKPMLLITVLFAIALVTALFNPSVETERILYGLFAASVAANVLLSLGYRYVVHRSEGVALPQLAIVGTFVLAAGGIAALVVYRIAENARQAAGTTASWLLQLVLAPFSGWMEKLGVSLSTLSNSEKARETIDKMGPTESAEKNELAVTAAAADFPVEIMLASVLAVVAFVLVLWLKKWRKEKPEPENQQPMAIERMKIDAVAPLSGKTAETNRQLEAVDLHHIRAVYRDFEHQAAAAGFGRSPSETVREWAARMGWQVSDGFFATYEFVRYGQEAVSANEAYPFLKEITQLSEKIFNEKV